MKKNNELKWQSPTTWSKETHDGKYYIEKHDKLSKWGVYEKGKNIGFFFNIKEAKEYCKSHQQSTKEHNMKIKPEYIAIGILATAFISFVIFLTFYVRPMMNIPLTYDNKTKEIRHEGN